MLLFCCVDNLLRQKKRSRPVSASLILVCVQKLVPEKLQSGMWGTTEDLRGLEKANLVIGPWCRVAVNAIISRSWQEDVGVTSTEIIPGTRCFCSVVCCSANSCSQMSSPTLLEKTDTVKTRWQRGDFTSVTSVEDRGRTYRQERQLDGSLAKAVARIGNQSSVIICSKRCARFALGWSSQGTGQKFPLAVTVEASTHSLDNQ